MAKKKRASSVRSTKPRSNVQAKPRAAKSARAGAVTASMKRQHLAWLLDVTGIPTAAGREDRIISWVRHWVDDRPDLLIAEDRAGNLLITQRGASATRRPLFFQAHLDHPAFVVRQVFDSRRIELEFRGGVADAYFQDAKIDIFDSHDLAHTAKITRLQAQEKPFKLVTAELVEATDSISLGDVGRWALRGRGAMPQVVDGLLHAPACDDLAAVAAALAAIDVLRQRGGLMHVGALFTRAEEIGFVGTLAACREATLPKDARVICLENSRSFAESPIGGGPILRVGDKMSVFDPRLTNRISLIMNEHASLNPSFKWQRRLMPGGTCEATAFSEYGYEATCLCLPLGNYHNQGDIDAVARGTRQARVRPEVIAVADYHGLVEMLVVIAERLDDATFVTMKQRVDKYLDELGYVVFGESAKQPGATSDGKRSHGALRKASFAL